MSGRRAADLATGAAESAWHFHNMRAGERRALAWRRRRIPDRTRRANNHNFAIFRP
jgi:hypothetical protein